MDVIRKSHQFSFKIVQVITIVFSNPVNFLVNARLRRRIICQRIHDDVTICRLLAVESSFLYSIHSGVPCLSETLHIVDLWQHYVCCIRSGVTRCTYFITLKMGSMPVRITRGALVSHRYTYAHGFKSRDNVGY